MREFCRTEKSKVKRLSKRGFYDRETIYKILDDGIICHVSFIINGQPFIIPTAYARVADNLYIHGAKSNQMMNVLNGGADACIAVTLLDGYVLARSAFHHSMNYRSAVLFGKGKIVEDKEEKLMALKSFSEHLITGRWADARNPNDKELSATIVLKFSIEEASAKIRTGPPVDDKEDYESSNVWAGVVPFQLRAGEPIADEQLKKSIPLPDYLLEFLKSKK